MFAGDNGAFDGWGGVVVAADPSVIELKVTGGLVAGFLLGEGVADVVGAEVAVVFGSWAEPGLEFGCDKGG